MATWRVMGVALAVTAAIVAALTIVGGDRRAQAASGTVSDPNCARNGLQAQISAAPTGGVITFNCASALIAITQTLVITANTTLDGANGGNQIILDGGNVTRIISLTPGVALTLTNITLQRGNAGVGVTNHGGAVHGDGTTTVTLSAARVLTNTAGSLGGGVRAGVVVVTGSSFLSNTASAFGGGLWAITATVTGSSFVSNTVGGDGGGVRAGVVVVTGSSFLSNTAGGDGGGLSASSAATVTGSGFAGNTARDGGGLAASAATVTDAQFARNTAGRDGGGLSASGWVTVTGGEFVTNTAQRAGGGLFAGGAAIVSGTQFVSNTATTYDGGGLFAIAAARVTGSGFVGNRAGDFGGGLAAGGAVTLTASRVLSNTAGESGGGVFSHNVATVTGSAVVGNVAQVGSGGGLWASGAATLSGTQVISNTAGGDGGGLLTGGAAQVTASSFVSNTATTSGGGLFANTTAIVVDSHFARNTAGALGGGLTALGAATVTASSFVSNTAGSEGGGVRASVAMIGGSSFVSNAATTSGGGLLANGAAIVSGAQFLGNTAGQSGGGLLTFGAATVTGSSFVSNAAQSGGGLVMFSALSLTNSTLAANTALSSGGAISLAASSPVPVALTYLTSISNTAPDAAIAARVAQTATARGSVFQQGATGATCLRVVFAPLDSVVATDTSCGNAGAIGVGSIALGPLADNGGGQYLDGSAQLTHLPQPGSALIGGMASCVPGAPTDQRGVARPAAGCDIGAIEVGMTPAYLGLTPNIALAGSPTTVVTATGNGFIPGTVLLWNGSPRSTTFVNATTLTATIPATDLASATVVTTTLRYGADPTSVSANSLPFTVTQNGQTITFPNPGTQNPTSLPVSIPVTATASSGLPVTLTSQTTGVCTVSGFTVTLLAGGTCTLLATQPGDSVFAPASPVTQSFTINPISQTVAFPNPGTQNPASLPSTIPVTATASSGLPVTLTSQTTGVCTVSGFTVTLLTPGTCTLVANQGGNTVYAPASPVTQSFTINPISQTIAFPNPGTQNPASLPSTIPVTATATSGLPVTLTSQTAGVCTVSTFTVTLLSPGLCTLVANQGGNAVYAPASPVTRSFTVNAPSGGGGGGGGGSGGGGNGTTPAGGTQIVIATGFRNQPLGQ